MTIFEAQQIVRKFYQKNEPQEDEFIFTEAMQFLIQETKDPRYMMDLGGHYYEKRAYDLALKYYEMAAECKYEEAYGCLGYIWYYGRTGEKDYEKAFKYYDLSAKAGNLESAYKVADMYKNGYYVEKDFEKYKSMIEELYEKIKNEQNLFAPVPQIFMRLAKIRSSEGRTEDAISLYIYARSFLSQRLKINPFFGDLTNMKWLIDELYQLITPDKADAGIYDLFYYLKTPNKIIFRYKRKEYHVESILEDGMCVIHFEDKWYRTREEFFEKATVEGKRLPCVYDDLYAFEIF